VTKKSLHLFQVGKNACVFSNAPGYSGTHSASDILRMNVGMTRARRKLLQVGDSSTLCRHPFFVEMLTYVKGVGGYRTARGMAKISPL
jgi:superfamily I DNA and/or RNA helicase